MRQLRTAVEKWLAPMLAAPVHVTRIGHKANGTQGVRVEIDGPRGPVSLHFFRHGDGAWQVFPPKRSGLTMGAYEMALR